MGLPGAAAESPPVLRQHATGSIRLGGRQQKTQHCWARHAPAACQVSPAINNTEPFQGAAHTFLDDEFRCEGLPSCDHGHCINRDALGEVPGRRHARRCRTLGRRRCQRAARLPAAERSSLQAAIGQRNTVTR